MVGSISGLLCARTMLRRLGGRRALFSSLLVVPAALAVMAGGMGVGSVPVLAAGLIIVGFGLSSLADGVYVKGSAIERESRAHASAADQ
jgi:hypothetical protein